MDGKIGFEPPRGMRDFYPEDMAWRNRVFDAFRAAGAAYGFEPYDACVVESYELLARKAGEEVGEQIYHFNDKSERHLALRAEMTPTLARMVAQRQKELPFPLKWTTIAQCFRYERMTKGRKREHYQWNVDIIGEESILAEVEVIGAAVDALRRMSLSSKDFKVRIQERLMCYPGDWKTAVTSAPARKMPLEVYTHATLGALQDWTYGPEAGAEPTTTAAGRSLTVSPYETLTVDTQSPDDGVAHTVTFAAGTEKFRLRYVFGSTTPTGEYLVLANTGLSADQVEVTTNVDTEQYRIEQIVTPAGDVKLVVLPVEAKIAVWTGNGVRTDPTDADNWVVTGTDGAEIPGATPDAATYIRLSGETTLNVPAGTSVTSAGLLLASQVTLAADCDWSGLGAVALRDQSKIDLLGHTLTLPAFGMGSGGTGEITDSTTDAEHPGEFHLAVPANTTVTNDCVLFTGNLKFVKEGEGQILSKMSCSYTGGTVIAEGKWTTFNNGSTDYSFVRYFHFGQVGSSLEIAAGATLDVFGNYDLYVYKTRLAGTLTSSAYATTNAGNGGIGWLTIDGEEAFIDVVKHTVFNGGNIELPQVDLGGHTLKMDAHGGSGNQVCLNGFGFTNGTVKVVSGGWWRPCRNPADCSTADFEMGAALWLDADITVRNFKVTYGNLNDVNGTAHVYIKGVYSVGTGYMNNFVLLDGATLDVSGQEGTWSIESTRKADQRINFADGAKIALSIGRRRLADGEKLIGWTTPPANLSSLSFVFDEAARAFYDVLVESDGIYVRRRGLMLIFR